MNEDPSLGRGTTMFILARPVIHAILLAAAARTAWAAPPPDASGPAAPARQPGIAVPPRPLGPSVLSESPSVLSGTPSALDAPIRRRNSAWRNTIDANDRSTGYISPDPIHELNRIDRERLLRRLPWEPASETRFFFDDRERELRVDARQLAARRGALNERDAQRERERLMKLKEYQLFLDSADLTSLIGQQAESDRLALERARIHRDESLAALPANAPAGSRRAIEAGYDTERARILGFTASPAGTPTAPHPTVMPTSQPALRENAKTR